MDRRPILQFSHPCLGTRANAGADAVPVLALIRKALRNAAVRTLTHCLMLTLTRNHFNHMLAQAPDLQSRLLLRYRQDPDQ